MKAIDALCELAGCTRAELEREIRRLAIQAWNRQRKRVARRQRELHDEDFDELDEEGM